MNEKKSPLLIGRSLCDLSPAEIEDLLKLAGFNLLDIGAPDGNSDNAQKIHPTLDIFWVDEGGEEHIEFTTWERGMEDWSSCYNQVIVGEVLYQGWGPMNPVTVVKWFLDHGWKWVS